MLHKLVNLLGIPRIQGKQRQAVGELIQESDYYTNYSLDESAYAAGLIGITGGTASEDLTLISGATMTGDGVWAALQDVFAAYEALRAQ